MVRRGAFSAFSKQCMYQLKNHRKPQWKKLRQKKRFNLVPSHSCHVYLSKCAPEGWQDNSGSGPQQQHKAIKSKIRRENRTTKAENYGKKRASGENEPANQRPKPGPPSAHLLRSSYPCPNPLTSGVSGQKMWILSFCNTAVSCAPFCTLGWLTLVISIGASHFTALGFFETRVSLFLGPT